MKISTFGEFKTFLTNYNIQEYTPAIANFSACVDQYNIYCSCKKNLKTQKYEECNSEYISLIQNNIESVKDVLFSKITDATIDFYYKNDFFIKSISK
jgi:hypothetical protein